VRATPKRTAEHWTQPRTDLCQLLFAGVEGARITTNVSVPLPTARVGMDAVPDYTSPGGRFYGKFT